MTRHTELIIGAVLGAAMLLGWEFLPQRGGLILVAGLVLAVHIAQFAAWLDMRAERDALQAKLDKLDNSPGPSPRLLAEQGPGSGD